MDSDGRSEVSSELSFEFAAPADRVWSAMADPAVAVAWVNDGAAAIVGQRFTLPAGGDHFVVCQVDAVQPPGRVDLDCRQVHAFSSTVIGPPIQMTWEVEAAPDAAIVRVRTTPDSALSPALASHLTVMFDDRLRRVLGGEVAATTPSPDAPLPARRPRLDPAEFVPAFPGQSERVPAQSIVSDEWSVSPPSGPKRTLAARGSVGLLASGLLLVVVSAVGLLLAPTRARESTVRVVGAVTNSIDTAGQPSGGPTASALPASPGPADIPGTTGSGRGSGSPARGGGATVSPPTVPASADSPTSTGPPADITKTGYRVTVADLEWQVAIVLTNSGGAPGTWRSIALRVDDLAGAWWASDVPSWLEVSIDHRNVCARPRSGATQATIPPGESLTITFRLPALTKPAYAGLDSC